jgi:predicted outer membrane lipoprotein
MPHTTNRRHHGVYDAEAAAFWIFAGIIVVIAFRDVSTLLVVGLTLLAVAFAIVTAAWWVSRNSEHRVARSHSAVASVTHLRPTLTGQRARARSSRLGPRAA